MSGYTHGARASRPSVRLVSPYGGTPARTVAPGRPVNRTTKRLTGWIARSIMLATTGFAVLDLLLLASGGHH